MLDPMSAHVRRVLGFKVDRLVGRCFSRDIGSWQSTGLYPLRNCFLTFSANCSYVHEIGETFFATKDLNVTINSNFHCDTPSRLSDQIRTHHGLAVVAGNLDSIVFNRVFISSTNCSKRLNL